MILLPPNPQRACLRSFWAATCLVGAVLVVAMAPWVGAEILWLAAILAVCCAAGMLAPQYLILPYRIWDRLARIYAAYAEKAVLRISFFTVCVPAGWVGCHIQINRPPQAASLWQSRECHQPPARPIAAHRNKTVRPKTWISRYADWVWQPGEKWKLALLPYLFILGALASSERQATVPENIYTLF